MVLALVLGAGGCSPGTDPAAPVYVVRDRDGHRVSLADLRGRPALLTSWATWCRECETLLPALESFHEEQGDTGVRVVAVNVNAPGAEAAVAALERDLSMSMDRWRDVDNEFTRVFRTRGVPTSVLVDADGAVVRRWPGGVPLDDPAVRRLLRRVGGEGVVAGSRRAATSTPDDPSDTVAPFGLVTPSAW